MIEISNEAIERVTAVLQGIPKGAERAFSNALNRGLSKVKTGAFKRVKTVYAVQNSALQSATTIRVKKTGAGDLAGYVNFSGVKIPLYKFNVSPKAPGKNMVKAGVKKGSMTTFENAFIGSMSSGHMGIFERTGEQGIAERLQRYVPSQHTESVKEIMGLSMAQMVGNREVITELEKDAQEMVNKRIEHEIDRLLNGYGG